MDLIINLFNIIYRNKLSYVISSHMGNKIRKISRILGTNKLLFPKIIGINKHKFSYIDNIFVKDLQKL
jgi:hypothetical protein